MLKLADVSKATAAKAMDTPYRPSLRVGSISGTRMSGGRIWDYEGNSALTGTDWIATCERMLREDAQVASCARALMDTLASARWRIEAAPESGDPALDAQAARAVEFANEAFGLGGKSGRLMGGFESAVRSFLPFLLSGYRYLEEVYQYADGRVWLRRYADCEPSAHKAWLSDDEGELAFVEQMPVQGRRKPEPIPAHKLVLFTLDRTGQNYEGRGLLRPCYFPWRLKTHALDMLGMGLERWGSQIPLIEIDEVGLLGSGYGKELLAAAQTEAENQVKSLVAHDRAYLSTIKGVEFSTFGGTFDPSGADAVVALCDRQIAQAFLLGFLQLGVSDTGSRSVGEVQETFFGRAAVNFLDHIAAVVGGPAGPATGTLGRLLAWNFPGMPARMYPRLRHDGLDESPLLELLGSLPAAVTAGLLTATDDIEDALRSGIKAHPLPPELRRTPAERTASGGAMAAFSQRLAEIRAKRT